MKHDMGYQANNKGIMEQVEKWGHGNKKATMKQRGKKNKTKIGVKIGRKEKPCLDDTTI